MHAEYEKTTLSKTVRLGVDFASASLQDLLHDSKAEPYSLAVHLSCAM